MNIVFILKILLAIVIIFAFALIIRQIVTENKIKRISFYALNPLKEDSLSFSDRICNNYLLFIRKISSVLEKCKCIASSSKRYDKYIKYNNRSKIKAIDFISNKIIISLIFLFLTFISQVFTLKVMDISDYLIALLLGYYLLDIYLYFYRKRERKLISSELLRAVIIMNNAFKSGKSTLQAIKIASKELPEPINDEFTKMYIDMNYGLSVDSVFDRFAKRVDIDEAVYISSSLKILNSTGGNIVDVFSAIEKTLFDNKKLNEELKNISGPPKLIVTILLIVPIIFTSIIYIIDPNYFAPLFNSPLGYMMILVIIIMFIIYAFLLSKIMKVGV